MVKIVVAITEEAVGLEEEDALVEEEAEVTEDLPRRVGVAARVIGTITVEAVEATGGGGSSTMVNSAVSEPSTTAHMARPGLLGVLVKPGRTAPAAAIAADQPRVPLNPPPAAGRVGRQGLLFAKIAAP